MRRIAIAIVLGVTLGSLVGVARPGPALSGPEIVFSGHGVEVPLACEGPITTDTYTVSAPHPDRMPPGFAKAEIPSQARNAMNKDRGVPAGLEPVSDTVYTYETNGGVELVAIATPHGENEYMFKEFTYCSDSEVTPEDLFPPTAEPGETDDHPGIGTADPKERN